MDSQPRQWDYQPEGLHGSDKHAAVAKQGHWDHKQDLQLGIPHTVDSRQDQWAGHNQKDLYRDNKHDMDSKHDIVLAYNHDMDSGSEPDIPAHYDGTASGKTDSSKKGHGHLWGNIKALVTLSQSPEHRNQYIQKCEEEENRRWPTAQEREIAVRYQAAVGLQHLAISRDKRYLKRLSMGYFEPIPLAWSQDMYGRNPLVQPCAGFGIGKYEDGAEERLYWTLNHAVHDGKPRLKSMPRTEAQELLLAARRGRRAQTIDMSYISDGDAFQGNRRYKQKGYTRQVPAIPVHRAVYEMQHNVHEGKVQVDTMVLLDGSSSMGWDHDGFDQPRHIDVVHNILRRAVNHMEIRDRYPDPQGHRGVETVIFNTTAERLGKIGPSNFESQWGKIQHKVYSGGGTCVMSGWLQCKALHFETHGGNGNAYYDKVYGWQATSRMPKLSLLVLLDGEASDMDEFELELLGETWCYTTIVLIGQEDCPNHHRHAIELERISQANDHIQFYDCHGRICERLVVHDVLQRVYAENAPDRREIMNPMSDPIAARFIPPFEVSDHGSSGGAGGSPGSDAASAVGRALASNPEATSKLFSAGLKHGVPKNSPYGAVAHNPEMNNAASRFGAAAMSSFSKSPPPAPPRKTSSDGQESPAGRLGLVPVKRFGDSLRGSSTANAAAAPPVHIPPAFESKKVNTFAPPPVRRGPAAPPPQPEPEEEPEAQGEWAEALYEYASGESGDLPLAVGQRLLVTERTSDDWWTGEVDGRSGLFPATYVKLL
ncbi:hypothetical protein HWV62_28984 [Athelia sp. TMB]|nr:hypothetical protein HWV62_28984 [Athelia sp. TMB]